MNASVNQAICKLVDQSKLESVSVLIKTLQQYPEDINALKKRKNKILVGLHLDIFEENFIKFIFNLFFNRALIRKQITTQLQQFLHSFGFYPEYIDGHQHCHIYPFVADILFKEILKENCQITFIRSVKIHPSIFKLTRNPFHILYLKWLYYLAQRFDKAASANAIALSGFIFGSFNEHATIDDTYNSYMQFARNKNDVFFCHPSLTNPGRKDYDFFCNH